MTEVALLNPTVELDAARRLLKLAEISYQEKEMMLLNRPLDRDDYIGTFAAMVELRGLYQKMENELKRMEIT